MGVLAVGVLIAPILADTFPILSSRAASIAHLPSPDTVETSIAADEDVFRTQVSVKPRDRIIEYTVAPGDTITTIADKFQISADTIRWANDLRSDSIDVGDVLRILPVSGIVHKVQSGDTVFTIAKKYGTNPQQIVDFPFNDFANPETFALVAGQMLIVPDGRPQAAPIQPRRSIAQIPSGSVVSSGGFFWPVSGAISQSPSWYHNALDIANSVGTPIVATKNGTVAAVYTGGWNFGYGTHVVIDHGAGITSLYAHMSSVNVSAGQEVAGGKTVVGWIGMTGRTTGPHVHFEIRRNNTTVNPLSFLP